MEAKPLIETMPHNSEFLQTPIAIIGVAAVFPQARNVQQFWENILSKADCITEVPPSRWKIEDYYDPDPAAPDKTYCCRGGFIPDIDFDPLEFGLPPNLLEVTDVVQLLSLVVAKEALMDAGYVDCAKELRDRTGVILGLMGGSMQLLVPLATRLQYPVWKNVLKSSGLSDADTERIVEKLKLAYVGWQENSYPGYMGNLIAGRIANRLDLGGINCVVDAACASSLSALKTAITELTEYRCDMMLSGGVDLDNSILNYLNFSKTPAFSKQQSIRPFDAQSDGMIVGEGLGILVLKRLEDAIRDKDRIYAAIRGIGSSSDGRHKSIYAPHPEGQAKALRSAYASAGIAPDTVGLVEAHGTGTKAGDLCEFTALNQVFRENNNRRQHIALGSVKSQIGHTKGAAGAAGLIKAALALHHKVLPPTINISRPNPELNIGSSPFYLNTETRPWVQPMGGTPRRAGVSSFGFGGTNYHVVLEEYQVESTAPYRLHRSVQSVLVSAPTPAQLLTQGEHLLHQLQSEDGERQYIELTAASRTMALPMSAPRFGFVCASKEEACELLHIVLETLHHRLDEEAWEHPQGIYYRACSASGKVVALFPGQGSQYLDMCRELAINFPPLREVFATLDRLFIDDGLNAASDIVFPAPAFDPEELSTQQEALHQTEYSQAAISAVSTGLYRILRQAGFSPDFVAGHSFGELTALWAAGVLDGETYFSLVRERGKAMAAPNDPDFDSGSMLAVKAEPVRVQQEVAEVPDVTIANWNSNHQVVLAGSKAQIVTAKEILETKGYRTVLLPVAAAFHTPMVRHAQERFAQAVEKVPIQAPQIPIFSNATGGLYPTTPAKIRQTLKEHILQPVLFKQEIENIYAKGGYFFVEVGPKNVLTNLVKDILAGKPHLAVALNASSKRDSDRQLREAVLQLRVAGIAIGDIDPYQLPTQVTSTKQVRAANVRLSAYNYLSDKTKAAFEQALQDGHQVTAVAVAQPASNNGKQATAPTGNHLPTKMLLPVPKEWQSVPHTSKAATNGHHRGENGSSYPHKRHTTPHYPNSPTPPMGNQFSIPLPTERRGQEITQPTLNHQRFLNNLELNLSQFSEHQNQLLQLHQQQLNLQISYTQIFAQLMQQQYALLTGADAASNPAVPPEVLDTLERSMMHFHNHMGETLRSHEQYLDYQAEYTQTFYHLTQQQYTLMATGDLTVPPTPLAQPTPYTPNSTPSMNNGVHASEIPVSTANIGVITQPAPISTPTTSLTSAPEADTQSATTEDQDTLTQALLEIVSQKTGYPSEMLEPRMELEADLSIDSIQQIEILAALQQGFPDLPRVQPADLAHLRTLEQIAAHFHDQKIKAKKNCLMPLSVNNPA